MTQTPTAPPATFSSPVGAAAANAAAIDTKPTPAPSPHWTVYFSAITSLVMLVGGGVVAYQVHAAHTDDIGIHQGETLKDHEARIRVVEQLPGRMAVLEEGQKALKDGQIRIEGKVDQMLARPSK